MILRLLKDFRDRTYAQYEKDHSRDRPEWMKRVMRLHDRSSFLFYFDDVLEADYDRNLLEMAGETVKMSPVRQVCLYNGEGVLLGEGEILSDPEEKEQGRKGLLKRRRQTFSMNFLSWKDRTISEMSRTEWNRTLNEMVSSLSLISDCRPEAIEKD